MCNIHLLADTSTILAHFCKKVNSILEFWVGKCPLEVPEGTKESLVAATDGTERVVEPLSL